jgi:hypothetical protein
MSKGLKGFVAAALMIVGLAASQASAQNLLANPGFEDPITFDGPPFIGSWEGFNGGAGSSATNSTASPHSGAQNLDLTISGVANTFAGAFQDVLVTPGQTLTFSGFQRTPGAFNVVNEVRFEWRNSVSNTEVGRTANFSPIPTAAYAPFSINGVVPAGADTARIVYAIQSFTGDPAHTGTVYIDDVNASVPEPTSLALLGAGALLAIRRRRAA